MDNIFAPRVHCGLCNIMAYHDKWTCYNIYQVFIIGLGVWTFTPTTSHLKVEHVKRIYINDVHWYKHEVV